MRKLFFALCFPALTFNVNAQLVFSNVYTFQGTPDAAMQFVAPLARGPNGSLYGVANAGGTHNQGAVFQITPPALAGGAWTETLLYSFAGGADGKEPIGGLLVAPDGVLFGVTELGGVSSPKAGLGTVFALLPPSAPGGVWTKKILHDFQKTDGLFPWGSLVFGPKGSLLGTTSEGGHSPSPGFGTVFQLSPSADGGPWTFATVYSFEGENYGDGSTPLSPLTPAPDGTFFGVTASDGTTPNGTVFHLVPPVSPGGQWTESVLYSFQATPDGVGPGGGVLVAADGTLYGTTSYGGTGDNGGIVYQLSPPAIPGGTWTETVLHSFYASPLDGAQPVGELLQLQGGQLIGACSQGGPYQHGGIIFSLAPPLSPDSTWTEHILYTFNPSTGGGPIGPLNFGAGKLIGAAGNGANDNGEIYELTEPGAQ